jgi:hypothetical protein
VFGLPFKATEIASGLFLDTMLPNSENNKYWPGPGLPFMIYVSKLTWL